MTGALQGQVAWITGAGSGIGLAAARALASAGATVVLSGRRPDPLEAAAAHIRATGGVAEVAALDVTDAEAVAATASQILQRHGNRMDVLVNCAGTNTPERFWRDQSAKGWRQVIATNMDSIFYTTYAVLPAMRARRSGLVINVSSWAGVHHPKLTGPAYNGSKHAVVAMTETINMEDGVHGIRACSLCPAEVATPILDTRPTPPTAEERARMLQPDDVGRAIRFMAELPAGVCINQLVISPTWNRFYINDL
ncbi:MULTISPECIES: SDR family oxidoreductase [unclassified Simplicispira]|uniref:SDR family oxidoreductase n=1 Tax=unclassified Simplicispira TaxID=2630407 RepID=UPI000D5D7013|nr:MULTISPECIES: SDR family oxidoreductase [unclassified Simplicispira]PVY57205.1 NADP-dependent 3-hydroxy acid dehydrogenase YdfG [Simplicispira sp. 125]REG18150.1 NADP-dependent 3-hydroxy acid dehydrogenase YdfG [Simplicispira sp. 110]